MFFMTKMFFSPFSYYQCISLWFELFIIWDCFRWRRGNQTVWYFSSLSYLKKATLSCVSVCTVCVRTYVSNLFFRCMDFHSIRKNWIKKKYIMYLYGTVRTVRKFMKCDVRTYVHGEYWLCKLHTYVRILTFVHNYVRIWYQKKYLDISHLR